MGTVDGQEGFSLFLSLQVEPESRNWLYTYHVSTRYMPISEAPDQCYVLLRK